MKFNFYVFFFTFFVFLMVGGLWVIWVFTKDYKSSREKSSTFECGFDKKDSTRLPFSLRFFLLMVLFLVFDIELCLLLKMPYIYWDMKKGLSISYLVFFTMLIVGTLEEWRRGALEWSK